MQRKQLYEIYHTYRTLNNISLSKQHSYQPHQIDKGIQQEIWHGTRALTPLEQDILTRIDIGAMSLGSISYKTHRDIALAANTIAMALANVQTREELIEKYKTGAHIITSNCGEGGDVHDHLVKQFASARFGNTLEYIANGLILQYKASQGVKPGLGGALSALKVTELIAWLRKATPWTELYSPATNPDQFSIEELAELCRFYSTPDSILSIKLTAHPGVGSTIIGAVKSMLLSRLGARCRITITGE